MQTTKPLFKKPGINGMPGVTFYDITKHKPRLRGHNIFFTNKTLLGPLKQTLQYYQAGCNVFPLLSCIRHHIACDAYQSIHKHDIKQYIEQFMPAHAQWDGHKYFPQKDVASKVAVLTNIIKALEYGTAVNN